MTTVDTPAPNGATGTQPRIDTATQQMPDKTTSTTTDPVAVIVAVYKALAANDLDAVAALSSPDIEVVQSNALPYGGTFHGLGGTKAFTMGVFQALDSQVEVGAIFASGDAVVQTGRTRGSARATGKAFDSPEVHVWTVEDGLVTSLHAYVDAGIIAGALTS